MIKFERIIEGFSSLRKQGRSAFDLMQLLIAMAILVVLAGVAVTQFTPLLKSAEDSKAQSNVQSVQTLVESCFTTTRAYASCVTAGEIGSANSGITVTLVGTALTTDGESSVIAAGASGTDTYTIASRGASGTIYGLSRSAAGVVTKLCGTRAAGTATSITANGGTRVGGCPANGAW